PQREYPYSHLLEESRRRGIGQPEYELIDSAAFEGNRYFDVFVEYAQAATDEVLMRITVENRGPEPADIHLLPQIWFRNTWSWKAGRNRPALTLASAQTIRAQHAGLGTYFLHADGQPEGILFCDNETNSRRLWNDVSGPA